MMNSDFTICGIRSIGILLMCLSLFKASGQENELSYVKDTSFIVNAGTKLNDVLPTRSLYLYPSFVTGYVYYKDGRVGESKMNYNLLVDEIQFINKAGDTLALADEPTIRIVHVDTDSFFYDRGYVRVLKTGKYVKLGVRQGFAIGDKLKHAGYDIMSSTSSVSSLANIDDGTKLYNLEVRQQLVVRSFTHYFFGDNYNHFLRGTQSNLIQLFPNCNRSIKTFCKKSKIDFEKREDLEKMVFLIANCYNK